MNYFNFEEYQKLAEKYAIDADPAIIYPALGLAGESGEVCDKVKKVFRDNNGKFTRKLKNEIALELSDVLWNVAILARDLGFNIEEIANLNLCKLADRERRNKIHGSGDNR